MASSRISGVSSEWGAQSNVMTPQNIHKPTMKDRLMDVKLFIFNRATKTVMGRDVREWGFIIGYHLVFYIFLILTLSGLLGIFYLIVDWNYPTMQATDSILKVPGLSIRPLPYTTSKLIRFVKGNTNTYTPYLDHMEAFLRYYENKNQRGENYIDCSDIHERRTTRLNMVCVFTLDQGMFGPCIKQQNFGFDDGQPCILLKLNKIFNWQPVEYNNETVPDEIRDSWHRWSVMVTCEGENPMDRDNMGPLTYYPYNGFPFKYFPFRNQQGYRSPFVFVQFQNPRPGVLLMITCKVWAKNIYHDENEMAGQVHFEILVD